MICAAEILLATSLSFQAQLRFDDDVEDTPIDGGIVVLAIAGAAFGIKKRLDSLKNHTS